MIKKVVALFVVIPTAYLLFTSFNRIPFGQRRGPVEAYYLDNGAKQTGSANIVTSIVVLYRGFDTLGEVTVLFLAATGLGAVLAIKRKEEEKDPKKEPPSLIMRTQSKILFPLTILFGAYIFIHGHLTPGGGFPGGVIVASAFLLMFIAHLKWDANEKYTKITEALAGMSYVLIGTIGLFLSGSFLQNFLSPGVAGNLFSAGIIPIIYIVIGFKVGSELTGLLQNMKESVK